jgi:hypothetical protein
MRTLQIGLSSWIIQDGNYEEFEVGREYRFALEFYAPDLAIDDLPVESRELVHLATPPDTTVLAP